MRKGLVFVLGILFIVSIFPNIGYTYSYGNPNEEKVAEVYKQIVAALNQNPADYTTVQTVVDEIKDELVKEFGQDVIDQLDSAIKEERDNDVIRLFQVILVRNIDRRFTNLTKAFDDYPQAKLLLAKAFATYEALSPLVQKDSPDLDKTIKKDFEDALKALGNPGLFGVGKLEPNRPEFDAKKEEILTVLKDYFKTDVEYGEHAAGEAPVDIVSKSVGGKNSGFVIIGIILILVIGIVWFISWLGKKK
ncbi:hypothetical protein L1765_14305 [Microaerobacter geothermalis]|uniref:hypothetical protein n=1 Tax=Microaerobacter geothermalis TaxID=674972 RepID=UPI001F3D3DA9|nr:hypothetical protein [Microaerobacter geothermalis]MCF6095133.1 hypothetical protein [Microaerobacter geothermalis]